MVLSMSETTLGQEMKRLRGDRPFREMERLTGINFSILARMEKNQIATPSRDTLRAMCNGYGMPVEYAAQLVYCGKPADDEPAPAERLVGATA